MEALCPHFGICGGCSRQDRPYKQQTEEKEAAVQKALADFPVATFHSILPSPETHFYRNKMEYSFGDERDVFILNNPKTARPAAWSDLGLERRVHLGLHPKGRFAIVTPTPDCQLLSLESRQIMAIVSEWANASGVTTYTRKNGQGDLRHLVIREGKNTGERMVNLVAKSTAPDVDALARHIRGAGVPVTTFLWTAHDGLSDVAIGQSERIFWGDGSIQERVGRITVRVTPTSFMQTNTHAAERMIGVLKAWRAEDVSATQIKNKVIDLYCGSGVIGLNLASESERLVGIEINKAAVADARFTAESNGRSNAVFIDGRAEDIAPSHPDAAVDAATCVVVDPPRAGLHAAVVETLLHWAAPEIYYVSCNPESLARDLRLLVSRYTILDVQPMDFFPHTDHVETAVRLRYKSIVKS